MTRSAEPQEPPDRSHGWEAVAPAFIRHSRRSTTGVARVRAWAEKLPPSASVLDLGCGPGGPRSEILHGRGFGLYAVDASPSLAKAYRARFPSARVACEPAEDSLFFGEMFDGVLAWGLMFLLPEDPQRVVIRRVADVLRPGGSLLFTAPERRCRWDDLSTGRPSISLGADGYRKILTDAGLSLHAEYDDEGENHYYEASKP
ncbi:MAG: class I SAM-dependent methyltransferase [Thermoanaerobaculia bacterium]|nr:class I SAM-dependent methyltransferase [Thermoanaerobaculia bacterium]